MRWTYILTISLSLIILQSCKQSGDTADIQRADNQISQSSASSGSTEAALRFPLNIQNNSKAKSLEQTRVQALSVITHRQKTQPNALSILTNPHWIPEFVFNSTMSAANEYAGYWIRFDDDHSYTYGYYDEDLGGGQYHYDMELTELHMLDNNIELQPKVWSANNTGMGMALAGKHHYGVNNGMQIKMLALSNQPSNQPKPQ